MLFREQSALYIHVRKTAGTSVGRALGLADDDPDVGVGNDGVLDDSFWQAKRDVDPYVFACVRNPYDRVLSSWKYCASTRRRSLIDCLRNPPRDGHDYRHFTRAQSAILLTPDGVLVSDFLMRFESLQGDFDAVCRRIGLPARPLPRLNRTRRRRHYRHYFDAESRRLATELFAVDIERFGYVF